VTVLTDYIKQLIDTNLLARFSISSLGNRKLITFLFPYCRSETVS